MRGRTDQANELADWLRKVTLGKGVRKLKEDFSYSTTSWSDYRNGSRLPSAELLKSVVEKYIREPQMCQRQLAEGLRLLEAARRAEAVLDNKEAPPALPVTGPQQRGRDVVSQALLRLDDARLRQIEAMQKLAASERRRLQLEDMVSVLQERCTILEGERDRAREDARAELERELQMSLEYRRQADEKLDHARRAEEKAYQLRLAAEQQVSREQIALNRIDEETVGDAADAPGTDRLGLPPLDQIHDVLQAAQEQLDAQDEELDDLEELIGLDPAETSLAPAPAPPVVPGQLQDNPLPVQPIVPGQPRYEREAQPADRQLTSISAPKAEKTATTLALYVLAATTPQHMGLALSQLYNRAGGAKTWPIKKLAASVFPTAIPSKWGRGALALWLDGTEVPADWAHLHALLSRLNASYEEIAAFTQAHLAIGFTHPPKLAKPPATGTTSVQSVRHRLPLRVRDCVLPVLCLAALALLATGYAAALHADPGPAIWKMISYGLSDAVLMLAIYCGGFLALAPPPGARNRREWPVNAVVFGGPVVLVWGAVAAFYQLDSAGKAVATFFGLM